MEVSVGSHEEVSSLDFSSIDDLDPSLADGSKCIFEREVPIEIRALGPSSSTSSQSEEFVSNNHNNIPIVDSIRVKLLTKGTDDEFTSLRIEFSSETDLFFHYVQTVTKDTFDHLQSEQRLMVDFLEFPNVLIKMLNACIREPKTHLAILVLYIDGDAKLEFIQNMEYKHVELMTLQCKQSDDEMVQRHITFRYNSMKQKLAVMQTRLHEINNLVKSKNPSLLLQIQTTKGNNGALSSSSKGSSSLLEASSTTARRGFY